MSAIEQREHTLHEYERVTNKKDVYRCVHSRCSHYQKRVFLEGKEATCPKCKNAFILTWSQLRNKRPVCAFCTKSPKAKELHALRAMVFDELEEHIDEEGHLLVDPNLE